MVLFVERGAVNRKFTGNHAFFNTYLFFFPYFRVTVSADHSQDFDGVVFIIYEEMDHVREFLNWQAPNFIVSNGINIWGLFKGVDLPYGYFLKSSTEALLLIIVPVGDLLNMVQGIRINLNGVFFIRV